MTVSYAAEVTTVRGLGCFWKLLFRWRGSIYKMLWPNCLLYSVCYFGLSAIYRFGLNTSQRSVFRSIAAYCNANIDLIPLSFVLGFYVSIVITRWWDQYMGIPWPDSLAMFVSSLVSGNDERGRLMRRTILRYVNLSLVITLSMMCPRVKKRFPTLGHLVEAGFMEPNEKKIFEDLDSKTNHPKYWMPLVWAASIVTRARREGRIQDDFATNTIIDNLCVFRERCGGMLGYDWVSIPLVYTQVVTLAVYIFFFATLMGRQFVEGTKVPMFMEVDLVVPIFSFLQFFFYMGWLKVAESLVNPFGEDDDDFEVNWMVDRNLQVSYLIVDEMHYQHPELVKDQYWDQIFPSELPYTAATKQYQRIPPQGSTKNLDIPPETSAFLPMETVLEEEHSGELLDDDVIIDLDHNKLDLENGIQKRRETHPMRFQMGRKPAMSSKISGSPVAGGPGHLYGVRCRAGEIIEGKGFNRLGLSYSSSTVKGMSSWYQHKNQTTALRPDTSFHPGGRKHSTLSMFKEIFSHEDHMQAELTYSQQNHGLPLALVRQVLRPWELLLLGELQEQIHCKPHLKHLCCKEMRPP
ncbi:bestrophin-4-like isoform X2 [Ischnura elegans]|uniref:bestrophin-4-like isoform X2 n=1 Tax=Ischnura elegans TaxID=197161 RepID=UPI001ED8A021|nr:bestrophin-4-like isoform X2 [Ischnura elegans]